MIDINQLRRLALDGDLAAMQEIVLRLEAAEKARDFAKEEAERLLALAHDQNNELIRLREEGRTLRAKIEQMGRQEPVAIQHRVPSVDFRGECVGYSEWQDGKGLEHWPHRTLYALPGAKGEEK